MCFNLIFQGWQPFITSVVNQLYVNLKRIHDLGVKKIAVTALEPLGCLPRSTAVTSFRQCNGTQNSLVGLHNLLLQQAVAKLNNENKDSPFLILDLYDSFMTVFKNKGNQPGDHIYLTFSLICFISVVMTDVLEKYY